MEGIEFESWSRDVVATCANFRMDLRRAHALRENFFWSSFFGGFNLSSL